MVGKQRSEIIAEQNALIEQNKGVKRQRVEIALEEPVTRTVEASDYAGGKCSDSKMAQSIYSASSAGINFVGQSASPAAPEFRVPAPIPLQRKKRVKIALKGFPTTSREANENRNQNCVAAGPAIPTKPSSLSAARIPLRSPSAMVTKKKVKTSPKPATDAQDTARDYVSRLKKTVSPNEFILFKSAIKYYKSHGDLRDVTVTLDTILVKYLRSKPELLTGFKVFVRKDHLDEFDKFCDITISMADEVTQIGVPKDATASN